MRVWAALAMLAVARAAGSEPELGSDPELRREMEKVESANLESAAGAAEGESARALRNLRALMTATEADIETARVELEALLRDPEDLRRGLAEPEEGAPNPAGAIEDRHEALLLSVQMLNAKGQAFLLHASSVPLPVPEEDPVRLLALRASYNTRNRAADLRRARVDVARAQKWLGVREPWPDAAEALKRLEGYVAETKEGLSQIQAAALALAALSGPRAGILAPAREGLLTRAKAIETDLSDLERESELLRSSLILQKADRQLTGR